MAENSKIEWTETGRSIASNGYVLIRVGTDHPLADVRGYAYEHRLVASKSIGRWVLPTEQVHHRNEVKTDNRPENLEVVATIADHRVRHRTPASRLRLPGEENPETECTCGCGTRFPKYDDSGRPREYVTGHNRPPAETKTAFLQALADGPKSVREISRITNQSAQGTKVMASRLAKDGEIERVRHGVYKAKETNGKL